MPDLTRLSPRHPVLCPVVVGRAEELAILEAALARARRSEGGLAILVGEAGIGKTRLTREAERIAHGASMQTLRGRAVRTSAPIPFRPLAEAFHSALRATGTPTDPELEPYHDVLRAFVPEWATSSPPPETSPFLLLEGIVRLLRALAKDDGSLLVLEDLHWADLDTMAAVEYLADNLRGEAVLCIATIRSDEVGLAPTVAEQLAARRSAIVLHLSRLSVEQTSEMARAALGIDALPTPLLDAIGERADGVPFLIEEMLSAYVASGGSLDPADHWSSTSQRAALALPASYRELVRSRLEALDDTARNVVATAATLGTSFDWDLIPTITGLDRDTVLTGLRAAVGVQLIATSFGSGFRFRHALIPETVVADLLPPERAELCSRTAETIEQAFPGLPGEWCERAADLREQAGDHAKAATHLMEAAARAIKNSALASAEGILERGRALVVDDVWHRFGFDRMLVDVLVQSGKMARAEEISDSLMEWFSGKTGLLRALAPADMFIAMARAMATAGDWPRVRAFVDRARTVAQRPGKEAALVRATELEARWLHASGDTDRAIATAARALSDAEKLDLGDVAFEMHDLLGTIAARFYDVVRARTHFERSQRVAETSSKPVWRIRALLGLGELDVWDGSIARLEDARELAAQTGSISLHAHAELLIAWAHVVRFELEAASDILVRCVEAGTRYRLPIRRDALLASAVVHAYRGDRDAMALAIGAAGDGGDGARAVLALVREERIRAIDHLEQSLEAVSGGGQLLSFTPALWALLRTLEGGGDEARERARTFSWSRRPDNAAALHLADAVALGRDGKPDEAMASFEHAERLLVEAPWNLHLGRRLAAEAAIADGWGSPVAWLRESTMFFEDHSLERMAAACRSLLRKAGAPVPRKGRGDSPVPAELKARGVTSREMDILVLVAERLSNREIAERLFLSPRTVETHVASLGRKLETADRASLVAWHSNVGGNGER